MVAFRSAGVLLSLICALAAAGQAQGILSVTPPEQALGFRVGDDYMLANYTQMLAYWQRLDTESDRLTLVDMGPTAEGRRQVMAVISAPENLARLDHYRDIARRLAVGEELSGSQARELSREGKAVIWIDGGLHANETVGSQQLIEMVYKMVSSTDPEVVRLLNDTIQLYVPANPDGIELVANWYMREPDPTKRSLAGLPRLYHKYIGHDDNRDFFLSSQLETTNMNRVMFSEWFPQIVYNHHQSGPAGTVVFIPPFRDPFNYNMHPLIPLGIEAVGTAMHSRLIAEGKGGSVMRSGASYSTWWNGGLRTVSYFHNMIGLLTEIVGSPTPIDIPLVPDRQLPIGDSPLPVAPGRWHFRQSIDYEVTQNLAVLDYASRNRETLLYNMYVMARDAIQAGSRDSWTVTPRRVEALRAAAAARGNANRAPAELYSMLRDPKNRDPRGYIVPADQTDFLTAIKFVNTLLKTGVTVHRATAGFEVAGKAYPAGSFVVRTAQAFRAHVLDMFEPQDHPNDFQYPGGPPVPPYDITGWTLAMQMGVKYDRVLDAFDGPFAKVTRLLSPPAATISDLENAAGYCIGHRTNDSFIAVNRLLAAGREVFWMQASQEFCTAAAPATRQILARVAAEIGVGARATATAPSGAALKLKPMRIGLYDQYGGQAPSGWMRWLFEQFEFPYSVVYPTDLDAGDLRERFDVLVFADEAFREGAGGGGQQPRPETIPAEFRNRLGRITQETTLPRLRKFAEAGGAILTIGTSTSMAALLGIPAINHLTEEAQDGSRRPLPRGEFYVPGSLIKVKLDTSHPLAHGMNEDAVVFFDSSPVFRIDPAAARRVAWYAGAEALASGWAWGQKHLDGGMAVAEAPVGEGKLILYGPEVVFRAQPHGTFKLLFNGLLYGAAEAVVLP